MKEAKRVPWAELNIFGETWIIYKGPLAEENIAGNCNFTDQELTIDLSLKEKSVLFIETLIHEHLHGLFRRMSYYQSIPPILEEIMNDQIAKSIAENYIVIPRKLLKKHK